MRVSIAPLAAALILPVLAAAQGAHSGGDAPPERPRSGIAQARYPQSVRVGDLVGRLVIEDTQQQAVLGRILAATRDENGTLGILMEYGGWLGFGTRRIVVPMEALALLGRLVVLKDMEPARLATLPDAPSRLAILPQNSMARMGLARN